MTVLSHPPPKELKSPRKMERTRRSENGINYHALWFDYWFLMASIHAWSSRILNVKPRLAVVCLHDWLIRVLSRVDTISEFLPQGENNDNKMEGGSWSFTSEISIFCPHLFVEFNPEGDRIHCHSHARCIGGYLVGWLVGWLWSWKWKNYADLRFQLSTRTHNQKPYEKTSSDQTACNHNHYAPQSW